MRSGTSKRNAATRKWPDPQHGSNTRSSLNREEHPMPMLVGACSDETLDLLLAVFPVRIAKLACMSPEPDAQLPIRGSHLGKRLRSGHRQAFEHCAGAFLCNIARCDHSLLKL